jgi:hypothetical protein
LSSPWRGRETNEPGMQKNKSLLEKEKCTLFVANQNFREYFKKSYQNQEVDSLQGTHRIERHHIIFLLDP